MTYRVYYNRALDYPQVWSVDEGTPASEVTCIGFCIDGPIARSHFQSSAQPCAWLEVDGTLTLEGGVAVFR